MEKITWKILLIDDDREDYLLTRLMLTEIRGAERALDWAPSFEAGREALQKKTYAAVLMDYNLGIGKGPDLIHEAVAQGFNSPFILLTGHGSYEGDVEAMNAGAALYLSKDEATPLLLERTIRFAIQYKRVLPELHEARDGLEAKVQQRTAEMALINRKLRAEIATRKSAENALLTSESQLKQIIGQIPAILWTMDKDLNLTRLLGSRLNEIHLQMEDLLGRRWMEAISTQELVNTIVQAHNEALQGGSSNFELQTEGRDYHCTVEPFKNMAGEVVGCLGIALDITAWKRREETILLQSTALEAAGDGILITDRDGVIRWCNPALTAITGFSIPEMIGKTPAILSSGRHPEEYYTDLWNTILSGREWRGETYNRRKDGTLYVEEQSITPVLDDEGNISNFIAIKQDISERKEAEEKITLRNWELQALNTISKAVSSSLELSHTFDLVQQLLSSELSVLSGAVFSCTPDQEHLHLETSWGSVRDLPGELILSFIDAARAIQGKKPILASIPVSKFLGEGLVGNASTPRQSDFLCIPLFSQGEAQGVLALSVSGSKIHNDGRLDFLSSLGAQIGVAIQNARLFKAEELTRHMAEGLRHVSVALSQSLDLDIVVETLLNSVQYLVPEADRITLLSLEDDYLQVVAGAGELAVNLEKSSGLFVENDYPLLHEVIHSQESRLVEDIRDCTEWRPVLHGLETRSWLCVPLLVAGNTIGLCSLESRAAGCFTPQHIRLAEALMGQAAIAIQNARLYREVRDSREHLQALSRKMVEIQEMERRYIARELHDETSQALIGLVFALEVLKKEAGDPTAVDACVNELNRIIGDIVKSLHLLAVDLRPAALDHLGLVPAIRQYIAGVREKHGLAVNLILPELPERLPPEMETTLYRIIQEGMANVVRHARATRVDVCLELCGDFRASINDDGTGFNLDEALAK